MYNPYNIMSIMNVNQITQPAYVAPEMKLLRLNTATIVCTSPEANFNSVVEEEFGGVLE